MSTFALLGACSDGGMVRYNETAAALRAELPVEPALEDFVRYAILVPNSHNTQPWKFSLAGNSAELKMPKLKPPK